MYFLERLRVVGASFVIFDLDLDNAALPPLSGDPNDVQDIGNARPMGDFTRNACEHVRRPLMHDAKHIGAGGGARRWASIAVLDGALINELVDPWRQKVSNQVDFMVMQKGISVAWLFCLLVGDAISAPLEQSGGC